MFWTQLAIYGLLYRTKGSCLPRQAQRLKDRLKRSQKTRLRVQSGPREV